MGGFHGPSGVPPGKSSSFKRKGDFPVHKNHPAIAVGVHPMFRETIQINMFITRKNHHSPSLKPPFFPLFSPISGTPPILYPSRFHRNPSDFRWIPPGEPSPKKHWKKHLFPPFSSDSVDAPNGICGKFVKDIRFSWDIHGISDDINEISDDINEIFYLISMRYSWNSSKIVVG